MHLCTSDLYVLCVMIFYACRSITWASGMALAYRLDAIPQGLKNSQFPGPNPLPLALVMDMHASKIITHMGRINQRFKGGFMCKSQRVI
jgi:hypothetical protein